MRKYIVLIASALIVYQCTEQKIESGSEKTKASNFLELTGNQLKNIPVQLVELEQETIAKKQLFTARTEVSPQNTVSITTPFGGYISRITLIAGNKVNQNQVVVVLEDPQYIQTQEEYLTTKVLLEQASADFLRQRDLNAEQAASDKVLQQAKATKNSLLIKKSALEQKLRLMNINPNSVSVSNIRRTISVNAPITGVVSRVFANVGQYISPADPILEIINPNNALLAIKVFEKDVKNVKVGQQVSAFTNAQPDKKLVATVTSISNQVNHDGTLDVYAKLDNSQDLVMSENMFFNVELDVESSESFVLPEESVVEFEGKNYVFVKESQHNFRLVAVKIGVVNNEQVEIISPNFNKKKIVGKGAYQLLTALKNTMEE